MKCPRCGFVQNDGAAECGECGVIFEKWRARQTPIGSSAKKLGLPAGGGSIVLLGGALAVLLLVVGTVRPAWRVHKAKNQAATGAFQDNGPTSAAEKRTRGVSGAKLMSDLCMQSMAEMGASEDNARVNCLDDAQAKERMAQTRDEYDKVLNYVPADQVAQMTVLLKSKSAPTDPQQAYEARLVLFDKDGSNVSSAGPVEMYVEPGQGDGAPFWEGTLDRSGFSPVFLTDEKRTVVFHQLQTIYPSRQGITTDTFEVTVVFNGAVRSSARIEVVREDAR